MKPLHDDEFDWDDLALGPSPAFKIAFWSIVAAFFAALAVLVFLVATAHAHEAPAGWTYPWSCCSSMDCQRVDSPRVHETPGGYVVDGATDADPIGYQDKRVKDSPDGDYHWCAHPNGIDANKTICLFAPPKGF